MRRSSLLVLSVLLGMLNIGACATASTPPTNLPPTPLIGTPAGTPHDPTLEELLELQEELNTTDVEITKRDSADPAVAGEELVYTLTVTNNGPNPASNVRVVDTLPAGVSYVNDSAVCVVANASSLTCDLGELLAGQTREITITVLVHVSLMDNGSGATAITNIASVENLAGPDASPSNNRVSEDTQIVADGEP